MFSSSSTPVDTILVSNLTQDVRPAPAYDAYSEHRIMSLAELGFVGATQPAGATQSTVIQPPRAVNSSGASTQLIFQTAVKSEQLTYAQVLKNVIWLLGNWLQYLNLFYNFKIQMRDEYYYHPYIVINIKGNPFFIH